VGRYLFLGARGRGRGPRGGGGLLLCGQIATFQGAAVSTAQRGARRRGLDAQRVGQAGDAAFQRARRPARTRRGVAAVERVIRLLAAFGPRQRQARRFPACTIVPMVVRPVKLGDAKKGMAGHSMDRGTFGSEDAMHRSRFAGRGGGQQPAKV